MYCGKLVGVGGEGVGQRRTVEALAAFTKNIGCARQRKGRFESREMIDRRISEKSANLGQLDAIWYALAWTGLEHAACERKTPYHDLLCTAVKEQ